MNITRTMELKNFNAKNEQDILIELFYNSCEIIDQNDLYRNKEEVREISQFEISAHD